MYGTAGTTVLGTTTGLYTLQSLFFRTRRVSPPQRFKLFVFSLHHVSFLHSDNLPAHAQRPDLGPLLNTVISGSSTAIYLVLTDTGFLI